MTVPTIGPVPPVPSRATQSQAEFSIATDTFFTGFPTLVTEFNASVLALNDNTVTVNNQAAAANAAADRAEAAGAFRTSVAYKLWTQLNAAPGTYVGQTASVFDDAGTHTDPVVGGTKDNEGIYRWSASPAGWEWVSDGLTTSVAWSDITSKPSEFTPSAHTHAMGDITGLAAALSGKAATGLLTGSGLTMTTGKLLGRSTGSTGAIEEITLGDGLSFDGTTLEVAGGGMVYPGAGIPVSGGASWGVSLAAPTGDLVGTTGAQGLTNKTLGSGTVYDGGAVNGGVSVSDSGTLSVSGVGFRGTPIVSASTRTLQASDNGKTIVATGNVTVPSGLPNGFACLIYNDSGSTKTIIQGSGVTMRLAGSASTGTRTNAQRGMAGVSVVKTNEVIVSGTVT